MVLWPTALLHHKQPCQVQRQCPTVLFLERRSLPRAEKLSAGGYSEKSETEVITRKPVVRL